MNNNINFTAKFALSHNTRKTSSKNLAIFQKRETDIAKIFEQKTANSHPATLLLENYTGYGIYNFILAKNDSNEAIQRYKTKNADDLPELSSQTRESFHFGSISNMTDEDAAKRLVDVFDAMELKAKQDDAIKKLKDTRKRINDSCEERIALLKEKGEDTLTAQRIQHEIFAENTKKIRIARRINDSEYQSFLISRGLNVNFLD